MNIKRIKLIIWDLDDTLWEGTISEGHIHIKSSNIELIKNLSYKGIINSICSKNDSEICLKKLSEIGIRDYFVFCSIDWTPKGLRVKKIIDDMNLRSENVLFIDDNMMNLKEAEYYNPSINTSLPNIIDLLEAEVVNLKKDDKDLSRLKQYKILEEKNKDSSQYTDNEEFLYASNICVSINRVCKNETDRLYELITRTNQLNFTKIRVSKEELENLIEDKDIEKGFVYVCDNYGDYGIVGFYALKNNKLIHFIFSCRIMGMGIEQYIYTKLNYPDIDIIEPVSGSISNELGLPNWINNVSLQNGNKEINMGEVEYKYKILLKGPCDLQVLLSYIKQTCNLITELNYIDEYGMQMDHFNHSVNIINSYLFDSSKKSDIRNKYPFMANGSFDTNMFNESYDVIVYSLLMDCTLGVYKNKNDESLVSYGLRNIPLTDETNWKKYIDKEIMTARSAFTLEQLSRFANEYDYIEFKPTDILDNIDKLRKKLSPSTILILVLGAELKYKNNNKRDFDGKEIFHKKVNDLIRNYSKKHENIMILDVNKFIKKQSDYFDNINHYSKRVYYLMSLELITMLNEITKLNMKSKSRVLMYYQNLKRMLYKFLKI